MLSWPHDLRSKFDQSHLQQFGDIVNKDGHKPHLTWPHKVLNLVKWQGFTCNTNSENSQQKPAFQHIFCFPKPSCEWSPHPDDLIPSPLTPFHYRGEATRRRPPRHWYRHLPRPCSNHGSPRRTWRPARFTCRGVFHVLEATVLPRKANFRTKCLNFLPFRKCLLVHFPASKKKHPTSHANYGRNGSWNCTPGHIPNNIKQWQRYTPQYIGTNLNQPRYCSTCMYSQ